MRNGRVLLGVLIGLGLFGLLAGASWYAYNVGLAQGVMTGAATVTAPVEGGVAPAPVPIIPFQYHTAFGFWRPFGFGFGLFGCLVPILFFLLLFSLFRFAFRPHWGGGWRRGGWDGPEGEIPPRLQEWHRRMHEQSASPAPPPGAQPE